MNGLSTEALDPATAFNGMFKDGESLNKQIKLLWIGMGTKEPNPFPGRDRSVSCNAGQGRHPVRLLRVARDRSRMVDVAT